MVTDHQVRITWTFFMSRQDLEVCQGSWTLVGSPTQVSRIQSLAPALGASHLVRRGDAVFLAEARHGWIG